MKLFDAHCHLQDLRFNRKQRVVIENAKKIGLQKIAVKATTQED